MQIRYTTAFVILALSASVNARAALHTNFEFTISDCSITCDSFAFLAFGTTISGSLELDVASGDAWTAADIVGFDSLWHNPTAPDELFDGDNFTTVNPFFIDLQRLIPQAGPAGPDDLISGGTSTAGGLINSGTLMFEVSSNGFSSAWLVMTIDSISQATLQLCLFFEFAECLPQTLRVMTAGGCLNTTVAGCRPPQVPLPAAFWLLLLALGSLRLTNCGFRSERNSVVTQPSALSHR